MFSVVLSSATRHYNLGLDYSVDTLKWSFLGGPSAGVITALGTETSLYTLLQHIGDRIHVYDDGEPIWWGYIRDVEFESERLRLRVSLESLYNAVAVAYTVKYQRKTTDWVTDDESIARWGRKEILLSKGDITDAEANTLAYNYLQLHKSPGISVTYGGSNREPQAKIYAYGFLERLDWRYYQNLTGFEGYEDTGSGGREIGEDDRPIAAQSFQLASTLGWTTNKVQIRPWKYPSSNPPTDNLIVELCSDNSGVPGTVLATATYAAVDVETTSDWKEKNWDNPVSLSPGVTYWLKIRRSGSVDKTKYFMVDTNRDLGYPRGSFYLYNTNLGQWTEKDQKGHLNFRVLGDTSIQNQLDYMIANYGGIITNTVYETPITTETNPYRYGDTVAMREFVQLLRLGSTPSSRLSCKVMSDGTIIFVSEPQKSSYYLLDNMGRVFLQTGTPMRPITGAWYRLRDVVPILPLGVQSLYDWNTLFAEEVEYSRGEYRISRTRTEEPDYAIGVTE